MTTTIKTLATLSRRVAGAFHMLFNRLTRKAELTLDDHRCHSALLQDGTRLQDGSQKAGK